MDRNELVNQALGRIAELLVRREARVGLNEIQAALVELADDAYDVGYDDALRVVDDQANEAAEREYRLRFEAPDPGE